MDIQDLITTAVVITAIWGFIKIAMEIITNITKRHDREQKWDDYDEEISKIKACMSETQTDIDAKLQEIKAEQCMLTYCMLAVLDGLHQQGCNGPVTDARSKLEKHINKQAHGVE